MKQDIYTLEKKKTSTVDLPKVIFDVPLNKYVVTQVVNWQRAKAQAGTHSTKGISDIQGTTKKPWKQKGTGRARQGSLRSPQFRGGAVIHGPVYRSHGYALPKKIRQLALRMVLSEKCRSGELLILDSFEVLEGTTKGARNVMRQLELENALFVGDLKPDNLFARGIKNLKNYQYLPYVGLNVYDALKYKTLALSKNALTFFEKRFQ